MVEQLTSTQRALVDTWERHMAAEFDSQSIEATMATMTADPVVNHVPVMTGGVGAHEVRQFYTQYFIGRHPPDTTIVPLHPAYPVHPPPLHPLSLCRWNRPPRAFPPWQLFPVHPPPTITTDPLHPA